MEQTTDYNKLFESFKDLNVLIIGDVMVDAYIWGSVSRISPEAPVPIVSVNKRESRLGGAANVARNIRAMGANPILCTVVGDDPRGLEFRQLLEEEEMDTRGVLQSKHRVTTTKFRVIGNNMQMLRVDEETNADLIPEDRVALRSCFEKLIAENTIDVILFQDYDKGVITEDLIAAVVAKAREKQIVVTVDPKKKHFSNYKNVTLFKPNLKELKEGLNIEFDHRNRDELEEAVGQLQKTLNAKMVMVTLSEDGILIRHDTNGSRSTVIPSQVRSVSDVSGAGDTVISVASLCLACDVAPEAMAFISNLAGGQVCERVGVVPVDRDALLNTLYRLRKESK
jgi:rfaE bifunctional protein kinase chain/domain